MSEKRIHQGPMLKEGRRAVGLLGRKWDMAGRGEASEGKVQGERGGGKVAEGAPRGKQAASEEHVHGIRKVGSGGGGEARGPHVEEGASHGNVGARSARRVAETSAGLDGAWEGKAGDWFLPTVVLEEADCTSLEAFEEPPDEYLVEELLESARRKETKKGKKPWCEALVECVGRMWDHGKDAGRKQDGS